MIRSGYRWLLLVGILGMFGGLWAGARQGKAPAARTGGADPGTASAWRSSLPDELQPLAAQLAESVEEIPVYLPADLPDATGYWSAFYDAGPDRFGVTLVESDQPRLLGDPSLRQTPEQWAAHLAGGPPGSLLLQPPGLAGRGMPVDLGRGVTGYQRSCARPGPDCPLTVLIWRTGGWSYYVWTAADGAQPAAAVQTAARRVVSALPAWLNPVRSDSSGYMGVRIVKGQEETGVLWFHPEADIFVGHRRDALSALRMAQQLEQVD